MKSLPVIKPVCRGLNLALFIALHRIMYDITKPNASIAFEVDFSRNNMLSFTGAFNDSLTPEGPTGSFLTPRPF